MHRERIVRQNHKVNAPEAGTLPPDLPKGDLAYHEAVMINTVAIHYGIIKLKHRLRESSINKLN